jgi:hypothetical protein
MEKTPSPSLTRKARTVNDASSGMGVPGLTEKRHRDAGKPSREDVSRCIGIWAQIYRLRDDEADTQDLRMPPRLWIGRDPEQKNFD